MKQQGDFKGSELYEKSPSGWEMLQKSRQRMDKILGETANGIPTDIDGRPIPGAMPRPKIFYPENSGKLAKTKTELSDGVKTVLRILFFPALIFIGVLVAVPFALAIIPPSVWGGIKVIDRGFILLPLMAVLLSAVYVFFMVRPWIHIKWILPLYLAVNFMAGGLSGVQEIVEDTFSVHKGRIDIATPLYRPAELLPSALGNWVMYGEVHGFFLWLRR